MDVPVVTALEVPAVAVGQEAVLVCTVTSDTVPEITWLGPINTTGLQQESNEGASLYTSTVVIGVAGVEHGGEYCCLATNEAGRENDGYEARYYSKPTK